MQDKQSAIPDDEAEIKRILAAITVKAWSDPTFATLLSDNSPEALRSIGVSFPSHIIPVFHVDTANERHFVIPRSPAEYISQDVEYHVARLAKLHAEVTSTTSWTKQCPPPGSSESS